MISASHEMIWLLIKGKQSCSDKEQTNQGNDNTRYLMFADSSNGTQAQRDDLIIGTRVAARCSSNIA